MEETQIHALDYVSALRRRKWWLVLPILASIVVGLLLVRYLPKQYKSSATVAAVIPGVSPNLVSGSATSDSNERMRVVSQQLLSSRVLSRVAIESGLSSAPDEALVARLRSSVSLAVPDPVTTTDEPRRFDTFIVSYSDAEPARAQRVANRLAIVFVDDNSKARQQRAEHTASFISAELGASQSRLAVLQSRLRRAKESHIGQLPEQTQANLQTLSGLRQQIDSNATALRSEQDRVSLLERQIEGMTQGSGDGIAPSRGATAPDAAPSADVRIVSLQRELAEARLSYTNKHPEVVRLEEELATAKAEAARDQQRPVSDRVARLKTEPAYRQLVADREAARLRIRELERADSDTRRQIAVYQSRVESAPMVEQELASVQRDYDLEKQQYVDLSAKLSAATIAENVERARTGEQFSVLYPAAYPTEPTKPVPLRVMLFSIVAGICLGGALMLGREYFDRSIHDVRELRDGLDLAVLGEVGHITPA